MLVEKTPEIMAREAVGVFDSEEDLQAAIDDLEMADFSRQDITVAGDVNKKNGVPFARRETHVTPEEYSLVDGAIIGGGLLLGMILAIPFYDAYATEYAPVFISLIGGGIGLFFACLVANAYHNSRNKEQRRKLRNMGLPLWVRTRNYVSEKRAYTIMRKHGGHHVQVHTVPVSVRDESVVFPDRAH